jgi:Flp pilus assembly protein TadG
MRMIGPRRIAGSATEDRGSIAVFTIFFAFAVLGLLALLVDGGAAMNARERAADIAEQAARAATDDLSTASLRTTGTVTIDWQTACTFAGQTVTKYSANFNSVTSATMTDCKPGTDPGTAIVSVQVTTKPVFPGFPDITTTATQTARAECGSADAALPGCV